MKIANGYDNCAYLLVALKYLYDSIYYAEYFTPLFYSCMKF